jgi:predicted ATPase/DNA-binding SARP family transcriptional activator
MLEVQLLGPLRVLGPDGGDLTPPGGRERQCLAILAAVGPDSLSIDRLTDELYGDRTPNEPRNAIQAVISRLRRSLGSHARAVETTRTGYRLVGATTDVDTALAHLHQAADSPDLAAAGDAFDRAMKLWRGEPFEGLNGELLDAERVRIENQRLKVEELILERRLVHGNSPKVDHRLLDELARAVTVRPLREKRWELLMLALYRDGQQAEALRAFQRARATLIDELGLEPGPALTELEQRILAHDPELLPSDHGACVEGDRSGRLDDVGDTPDQTATARRSISAGATLFPRLRSSLLGRDDLVTRVENEVARHPLVTLQGPGGIGKTSLAVAAVWRLLHHRLVHFVDLASVDDDEEVAPRVAHQLGLSEPDENVDPVGWIGTRLANTTDLVLVDNAEHVIKGVVELVRDVLVHHDVQGSFLVTSRRSLDVPGERVVPVPPLTVDPSTGPLPATGPAVQLFLDRVKAVQPDLEIDGHRQAVVADICRRLDGIPLAIELAAGRATVLGIDDIAARLDDQRRLLRKPLSTGEPRHESLEAVVEWSVDLLSPSARQLFERLSVMAGDFTVGGAEAMAAHCGLDPADGGSGVPVLDDLDELVRASLLVAEARRGRLRLLEPIRQVAQARLVEHDRDTETRRAHARWMADLLIDAHGRRDRTRGEAMCRIEREAGNLHAAISWLAAADGEIELVTDMALPAGWWYLSHDVRQGARLLGRLRDRLDRDRHPLAWAVSTLALAVATASDPRSTVASDSVAALAILDDHDHPDAGVCRAAAAMAQTESPDPTEPLRLLQEAERIVSSDDPWATAVVDLVVVAFQSLLARLDQATLDLTTLLVRGERAVATFASMDERWAMGVALTELGRVYQHLGDVEEAEARFLQGLEQLTDDHDYHGRHYVFTELGRMASARGEHERAGELHDQAEEIAKLDANPGCMAMALAGRADAAEARGDRAEAIGHYSRALELMEVNSVVETGADEWRRALARLTSAET